MKKFFLTAAAVSSLISSSAFADSVSSSDRFDLSLVPGINWTLGFGDFLKANSSDSSSKDSKSASSTSVKNFTHSSFSNVYLGARFAYNINDNFSVGISGGYNWQNFVTNAALYDAFSIKYMTAGAVGNYRSHIGNWNDAKWYDRNAATGGVNKLGRTPPSVPYYAENATNPNQPSITQQTTLNSQDAGVNNMAPESLETKSAEGKKLYEFFKNKDNIVSAKLSMSNMPITVDASWNFVNTGSIKAFVRAFAGVTVFFPSASIKISTSQFKEAMNSADEAHKTVYKEFLNTAKTSTTAVTPQVAVAAENNGEGEARDGIVRQTAYTPTIAEVHEHLHAALDGGEVKDMELNFNYKSVWGAVAGISLGTSWDFGPMYIGADASFSWKTAPSKLKINNVTSKNLEAFAKNIKSGSEHSVTSSINHMFGAGINVAIGFSF